MTLSSSPQGDEARSVASTPVKSGWFYNMFAGGRKLLHTLRAHPVWGVAFGLAVFVLAYLGNWGLDRIRDGLFGPDDYLAQIAEDQKREFADLKVNLDKLGQSLEGGDRQAYRAVESAVKTVEAANQNLIRQLALAKEENNTLRRVVEQIGISGGYDFILSEKQGIRLDKATVFAVDNAHPSSVSIGLSTKDGSGNYSLRSGQSLGYKSANGLSCRIALLSIQGVDGNHAASFTHSCDDASNSAQTSV